MDGQSDANDGATNEALSHSVSRDLYAVMSSLRAVRRLRPDPIPNDVLARVLQAACWAPSGGNQQPWRVIVVTSPETKLVLRDLYLPAWKAYSERFLTVMSNLDEVAVRSLKRVVSAGDYLAENLHISPAILVFCANLDAMAITDARLDRTSVVGGGSVYPAVQNAMLACVAEGLGCTLTTLHCTYEPQVSALLNVPERWAIPAVVPIGYPVGRGHGPISRNPPSEMAFLDSFGQPFVPIS